MVVSEILKIALRHYPADCIIDEGKALLETTRNAYDLNRTEDDETTSAYADFSSKKAELEKIYSLHRKKAKVVFHNDSITSEK